MISISFIQAESERHQHLAARSDASPRQQELEQQIATLQKENTDLKTEVEVRRMLSFRPKY